MIPNITRGFNFMQWYKSTFYLYLIKHTHVQTSPTLWKSFSPYYRMKMIKSD